jgi:hypothetical protein
VLFVLKTARTICKRLFLTLDRPVPALGSAEVNFVQSLQAFLSFMMCIAIIDKLVANQKLRPC